MRITQARRMGMDSLEREDLPGMRICSMVLNLRVKEGWLG